jgi:hypothetical protein
VPPSRVVAALPICALASPRFRRRLGLVLAALLLVGAVTGILMIGNTADPPLPLSDRPAIVEQKRPPARLSAAERRSVLVISRLFVLAAVRRDHPERAWPLASAALRSGTSLADWKVGTLPIPPYPVRNARWNLAYSVVGEVGLDVFVESTDPEIRPLVYRLTLVRGRRPSGPSWLVDGWSSTSTAPGGFVESPQLDKTADADAAPSVNSTPQPSRLWVLAPFAILLAALLIPLAIVVTSRRAERRTRRR